MALSHPATTDSLLGHIPEPINHLWGVAAHIVQVAKVLELKVQQLAQSARLLIMSTLRLPLPASDLS